MLAGNIAFLSCDIEAMPAPRREKLFEWTDKVARSSPMLVRLISVTSQVNLAMHAITESPGLAPLSGNESSSQGQALSGPKPQASAGFRRWTVRCQTGNSWRKHHPRYG